MAGRITANKLKKVTLGIVIILAGWSAVAAQQTSPSQQAQPSQAEKAVGLPPKLDQLKALRAQAEAAKDLSEADKKNVLSLLDRGVRFLEETERFNSETQQFIEKIKSAPARTKEIETKLRQKAPASDQILDPAKASRMTNAELEQLEREEKASLAAARASLNNFQDQIEALKGRPVQRQKESRVSKVVFPDPGLETRLRDKMPFVRNNCLLAAAYSLFLARISVSIWIMRDCERPGAWAWAGPSP